MRRMAVYAPLGAALVAGVFVAMSTARGQESLGGSVPVPPPTFSPACPNGAVNTLTGNYVDGTEPQTGCEICLMVIDTQRLDYTGNYPQLGEVCNIWSDAKAHEVMWRIGQCGVIIPAHDW